MVHKKTAIYNIGTPKEAMMKHEEKKKRKKIVSLYVITGGDR